MTVNNRAESKGRKQKAALVLVLVSIGLFVFNFERQTLRQGDITPDTPVVDYYAPKWDPFPHHLRIDLEGEGTMEWYIRNDNLKKGVITSTGTTTLDVYPGETLVLLLGELDEGSVLRTTLWCDSWNYLGGILLVLALILFII